ncbi:hypothetical protein C8F01DRAFT_701812 [Mycena amicta]|nr:hypothetical protein C8F01DRAFT_701812 [Mycena amicta]
MHQSFQCHILLSAYSLTMDPTLLPPGRFEDFHTYTQLISHPANRYLFRVHRQYGRGRLIPSIGFVARQYERNPQAAENNIHHQETATELSAAAAGHITQWLDGTSASLQSQFVSASFSLAYALFEAQRWNAVFRCETTHISVIDPTKIPSDIWLGTQLVGADSRGGKAPGFARWAQEVLVYAHIPSKAVVFTAPLETYNNSLLPKLCDPVTELIRSRTLNSTEAVADALFDIACSFNAEEERALIGHAVEESLRAFNEGRFNSRNSASPSEQVAWLAAFFCWWPKRMRRVHPEEFLDLRDAVRQRVNRVFQVESDRRGGAEVVEREKSGNEKTSQASAEKKRSGGPRRCVFM